MCTPFSTARSSSRCASRPIAPVLAKGLEILTIDDRHQQLLDRVVRGVSGLVTANEELIRQRIREESPWWVPDFVDDRVHDKVVTAIERTLREVAEDPCAPAAAAVRRPVARLDRPPTAVAGPEGKGRGGQAATARQPDEPRDQRLTLECPQAGARPTGRHIGRRSAGWVAKGLSALAQAALDDEVLLEKIDGWIVEAVLRVVEQHRHEVGQLIASTVSRWDPDETSARIELQVGRDLQFVRINGTLVGGLVGLILYALSRG